MDNNDQKIELNNVEQDEIKSETVVSTVQDLETEKPKKGTKKKSEKVSKTNNTSKKATKTTTKTATKKTAKRRRKKTDTPLVSAPRSRKYVPETVTEELQKITNTKSMEQLKKPRRIAFMVAFYVLLFMAAIVFCMIWFSKTDKKKNEDEYVYEYEEKSSDDYLSTFFNDETIEESSDIEDDIIIYDDITTEIESKETEESIEIEKSSETVSSTMQSTIKGKTTKETLKAVREATTKNSKTDDSKKIEKSESFGKITNTGDKDAIYDFEKEIYSKATYNQYTASELNGIKAKLATLYSKVKDKIFGDIPFEEKGKNGIIYLNYTNLEEYVKSKNDTLASEYDRLIPVDRLSGDVTFSFENAVDRGIYYDIPANNSQRSIMIKVLKGAKIGFSKNYNLTSTLEILDIECGTKLNTYYNIEDIVGKTPKYSGLMPGTGFNLDEALKTKQFNYVVYDKKGYITDLMWIG